MNSSLKSYTLCLFVFLCLIALGGEAIAEQRLALVVGNAVYGFSPLKNPVNDASDMAVSLQKLGFTVILKKNVNLKEMEESIQDFGNRLKRGGVGLFYFAGHGLQAGGVNYLVPIGARIDKESDIKYEAMDAGRILDEMANAANGLNIVILDACRDNPFARRFRSASRGLAIVSSAPVGTYISYSTGLGQVALDGEGRNSPFAFALMQFMKEPGLTIEQVFKNVRHKLGQETGGKQVPWELSSLEGDFFFMPGNAAKTGFLRDITDNRDKGAIQTRPSAERSSSEQATFRDTVTGMEFILVNGGCFQMGDSFGDGESKERPVHEVCVDDFYIGKYEVTQGQWHKVMGSNPSHFKKCGVSCPVDSVSWKDAQSFIAELSNTSHYKYRMPTEAEWEYAARGVSKMEKWAGTSSENKLAEYAWYDENSNDRVQPVGQKKPNSLGLYDMSGNVWEWVQDRYGETYYENSPKNSPAGPDVGKTRVLRGGSWIDRAKDCRTSSRLTLSSGEMFKGVGLRLVLQMGASR